MLFLFSKLPGKHKVSNPLSLETDSRARLDRALLHKTLERLPALAFLLRDDEIVFANGAARTRMKLAPAAEFRVAANQIFPGLAADWLSSAQQGEEPSPFTAALISPSGEQTEVNGSCARVAGLTGVAVLIALPIGSKQTQQDQTTHSGAQPNGVHPSGLMEDVLASLPEAIAITHGTTVIYTNPEFTRLFGFSAEEAIHRDMIELVLPESHAKESLLFRRMVETQGRAAIETVRRTKSGELVDVSLVASPLVENGVRAGLCLSYRDIRDRKEMVSRLQHSAMHDMLTGLPNRALFLDRLKLAMARRSRRSEQGCGVMFLDLDKFKEINDGMGHAAGDAVLVEVGRRLQSMIRPQDTAARLSGDEFAVLLDHVRTVADMQVVAERIIAELVRPCEIQGRPVEICASIGVALCGADHKAPEQLLRDADFAMYRAKQQGGGQYEVFDRYMQVDIRSQQERELVLRKVLDQREFAVWYQPFFRLKTGTLEGFESLLRWRRNDGSFDSFRDLLTLADGTGLSITINRETMLEGCAQLNSWTERWPESQFTLSVNLSGRQFYHPELVALVTAVLTKSSIDPSRLMFEIPEIALNETPENAVAILQRLVDRGVRIAVDNFGAGLAPINHLVRLPVDVVKLDPKLTATAANGGRQSAVLEALIQLGRSLGVQVVAQGVEMPDQLDALREMGCDLVQGFLFAPAVNAKIAGKMIEQGTWLGRPAAVESPVSPFATPFASQTASINPALLMNQEHPGRGSSTSEQNSLPSTVNPV